MQTLFDGSHLGTHTFASIVKWCSPYDTNSQRLIPTLRALIFVNGQYHCVLLKKNTTKLRTQCFIDELKDLFGLRKIGTNTIDLDGVVRKKDKTRPWICSNSSLVYDSFGFPILPSSTNVISDFFYYDSNVYIHKLKTSYYIFSVATYNVQIMFANEMNSFASAQTSVNTSPSSNVSNASANSNSIEESNSSNSVSNNNEVVQFYPNLAVKTCQWYSAAPGPWNKPGRGKKKQVYIEQPTDEQKLLYHEIQKIMVFRNLLNINLVYNKDVIFSAKKEFEDDIPGINRIPISINEYRFRNTGSKTRKNRTAEEQFFFPDDETYYRIVNSFVLNSFTNDNDNDSEEEENVNEQQDYRILLDLFKIKLHKLIHSKFPNEIYHLNALMEKLTNSCEIYNEVMHKKLNF